MIGNSRIRGLIPPEAAGHECLSGPDYPRLHPLEERQLAGHRMSQKRKKEFALGRWCARQAMSAFNRAQEPLLIGPSRAPIWPQGLLGSITHCEGYCAAAIVEKKNSIAIGIDAEPWINFPLDIRDHIATEQELSHSAFGRFDDQKRLAVLFSAKESIFKALNPLTGIFFDFLSTSLVVDVAAGIFSFESLSVPEIQPYSNSLVGRFLTSDNLVISSAYVPRL